MTDTFASPWSVSEMDGLVAIIAACGRKVTLLEPGQWHSQPGVAPIATLAERLQLAERICAAFNGAQQVRP